jgi:aminotransferase
MKGPSPGERATQKRYNLMQMASGMEDVVRLGAGDPDLHTPPEIIGEAVRRMSRPSGSVSSRGLDELRLALAEHFKDEKGLDYDPESEILITNGAQEALFLSMLALINPGEGVLVQDPRYSSYDQAVEAAGGRIIQVPTGRDHSFTLEPEDLKAHARDGKLLVFVNPNNPTASLVSPAGVREIATVAKEEGLFVISDEVYDKLAFDDAETLSVAECEGMREQTVILSSISKTYAMTGFRVGYLLGPSCFIDAAARLKKVISGRSPLFSQYAAVSALTGSQMSRRQILGIFTARRKVMMEGLDSLGIPYGHPGAGFFIWADISRFGMPADEFCRRLLLEARVLMFPGTSFGERWRHYVRISILEPVERIAEGIERIKAFSESITK